jgi:hypothetical protein
MSYDPKDRIEAMTHLKAAIMHVEAALSLDAMSWDYTDVADARDVTATVKNLVDILDTIEEKFVYSFKT